MTFNEYQRQQRSHGREIREAINQRFADAGCSITRCPDRVTYLAGDLALCARHAQQAKAHEARTAPAGTEARRREAAALRRQVLGA